jgi:aspartyl-tRNA synthetase
MKPDKLLNELETQGLEVVIGLETHIRLSTATKLFCSCRNEENEKPNRNICSVCTGQMGVLPAVNKEAVKKAILFGKAVNSTMANKVIYWDRKHYEYPDLPKNFQLTQYQRPIVPDGYIQCYRNDSTKFRVELEQVHIEEDAAKLLHEHNCTLVDFNKAGVPLIEVVTKPCIHDINDAPIYAQNLQRIVQVLKISEANLEKGEFKSDVSVSLRKKGTDNLNPRAEIKNLNSFKFMHEAIKEEVEKQLNYYLSNNTFRPEQTTVLFDADLKLTKTMRQKEFAADYRFALEPDIPPVNILREIEEIRLDYNILPFQIETILIEGGVLPKDAKFFTSDIQRTRIFLDINNKLKEPLFVARMLTNNLKPEDYEKITNIDPIIGIISLFKNEKISHELLQEIIERLLIDNRFDYESYIKENFIPEERIKEAIAEIIKQNSGIVNEINQGNTKKIGILIGKVIAILGKNISGKKIKAGILMMLSLNDSDAVIGEVKTNKEQSSSESLKKEILVRGLSMETIAKVKYRTHLISDITDRNLKEYITLAGWVSSVRDHGDLIFVDLRDSSYELFQIRTTRKNFPELDKIAKLSPETVIMVSGVIIKRSKDDYNPALRTGTIELDANEVCILNEARTLPFEIRRASKTNETVRLKYKFLDHRNDETRRSIINRHKVIKQIRETLYSLNFVEIETPILSAGTDEGAREFIVPSRKFPGKFYSLPQSPQQYKQMLMAGGFDKYFQFARCFRDEDSRGDRQPEFTQLDIEMAFVSMQDIIELNTRLLIDAVANVYQDSWKLLPFRTLTYKDAMEKYGTDRPDLRFGLEMQDITDIVRRTPFKVFADPINNGGIVKCIKVEGTKSNVRLTKGQIEKLMEIAQNNGLGGLAYIIVNENELQSPIIKYLGNEISNNIIKSANALPGDIVFFSAADFKTANKALDAVRQELGRILNLIKHKELYPAWIIDFPQYEKDNEGKWTFSHNPFSMPKIKYLQDHMEGKNIGEIISQQYDLILNGNEIGGGSIRANKSEILKATYRNMGYDEQSMIRSIGHMLEAFQYGVPPHGGIAWGIDRLMMILERKSSIRDVMAFPKTGVGEELLFNSPATLSEKKIIEANIKFTTKNA